MKPVIQTTFGVPEGNCFSACLASLLEIQIARVPLFTSEDWQARLNEWLAQFGYFFMDTIFEGAGTPEYLDKYAGFHIISGDGPRGFPHAVVGYKGQMVHDPHPDGTGLLKENAAKWTYGFLIPVNPERNMDKPDMPEERRKL